MIYCYHPCGHRGYAHTCYMHWVSPCYQRHCNMNIELKNIWRNEDGFNSTPFAHIHFLLICEKSFHAWAAWCLEPKQMALPLMHRESMSLFLLIHILHTSFHVNQEAPWQMITLLFLKGGKGSFNGWLKDESIKVLLKKLCESKSFHLRCEQRSESLCSVLPGKAHTHKHINHDGCQIK